MEWCVPLDNIRGKTMLRNIFKLGLAGIAGAVVLSGAPASAQTTGTVNVSGTVSPSCAAGQTVGPGSIPLGNLAKADGTVNPTPPGIGITSDLTVNCASAAPKITVTATDMVNPTPPTAGFTSTVHYHAHVAVDLAAGGSSSFFYNTESGTGNATAPTLVGGAIKAPATPNVHVNVDTLNTTNATDILESGNYGVGAGGTGGVITFVITPS